MKETKLPIDMMLDQVSWIPVTGESEQGDTPHVTHTGVLHIAGYQLPVIQLSNGERVIEEHDLSAFFDWIGDVEEKEG